MLLLMGINHEENLPNSVDEGLAYEDDGTALPCWP